MNMRVTQSMVAANSVRNLSDNYAKLEQYQNQVSTGKKITKPSDDPVAALKGMYFTNNLNSIDQYKRNITSLQSWLSGSENGLTQGINDLQRVRELAVEGMNSTLTVDDQKAIADEMGQIKQDLVNTANTQVAGKYIFHGTDVTNQPATLNSDGTVTVAANISDPNINKFNIEVSKDIPIKANMNPANAFNKELFDVVGGIEAALQNNDTSSLNGLLSRLDNVTNYLSVERSDIGARSNQVDNVSSWLDQQETSANQGFSDNMNVDIGKVITNLTTQQSTYQAALSVGARIIQPTLMDYLK
jgi:flagellar hook-associated protein 3 FlgL